MEERDAFTRLANEPRRGNGRRRSRGGPSGVELLAGLIGFAVALATLWMLFLGVVAATRAVF